MYHTSTLPQTARKQYYAIILIIIIIIHKNTNNFKKGVYPGKGGGGVLSYERGGDIRRLT